MSTGEPPKIADNVAHHLVGRKIKPYSDRKDTDRIHAIHLKLDEKEQIYKAQDLYEKVYGVKPSIHNLTVEAINLLVARLEGQLEE